MTFLLPFSNSQTSVGNLKKSWQILCNKSDVNLRSSSANYHCLSSDSDWSMTISCWIKVFSRFHLSFRNSATRFKVLVPPIMYAASGLWAVEYSDILLKWSFYKLFWIIRLTLSQMGNQDHQTISLYSYPKSPSRRNSLHCFYNIRWLELFLCSFQGHVYFDVSTLKIQLNPSFHHRN